MAEGEGWAGGSAPAGLNFIDTHCHVDRYGDPATVLRRARIAGVLVVAVSDLPSRFQRQQLRYREDKAVRAAIGIHPLAASRAGPVELSLFRQLLDRTDYVGEIGLDGSSQGRPTLKIQRHVFETVLSHHQIASKVLTVHSRGAEKEVIDALAQAGAPAILHWYSGPANAIEAALQTGIYFSVNPAMLASKSGQRLLAAVPRERILTETDGPYAKRGRRPTTPQDIPWLVTELGRQWSIEPEAAAQQIFQNMARLYARRAIR